MERSDIKGIVQKCVDNTKIFDIHTHLLPAQFKELSLMGPDELLTYHYLVAEAVRATHIEYEKFWAMKKEEQADFIFKSLFIERSPLSEACRGVLTTFRELGMDLSSMSIEKIRESFSKFSHEEYIDKVFELSGVEKVIMTNDPFDKDEIKIWQEGSLMDNRFLASLRLDTLINDYQRARYDLINEGYNVGRTLNGIAKSEIIRFIKDKINKMKAVYIAVSLPPDFKMPSNTTRDTIIEDCIIPVARELNKPLAMMIGAKRAVNPDLYLAGDSLGKGNIETVEYLCRKYPKNKFMITMLSRENQHELCVTARKFSNLYLFGCWWFLNNPVLIEEITRMRIELLGTSFMPQHSDARVIEQLIYKWKHSKSVIKKVLIEKYEALFDTGWPLAESSIENDVKDFFGESFEKFISYEL